MLACKSSNHVGLNTNLRICIGQCVEIVEPDLDTHGWFFTNRIHGLAHENRRRGQFPTMHAQGHQASNACGSQPLSHQLADIQVSFVQLSKLVIKLGISLPLTLQDRRSGSEINTSEFQ